jgi:uncharacterized protein (TIGR01777 family)
MKSGRIILAGGSGFLGRAIARRLSERGYEPVTLTRSPKGPREVKWDGKTVGDWLAEMDGALAVVNLAGKSVNCRYTAENRREIIESRVDSVHAIDSAIARCAHPPSVFVQAGSAAIYGDAGDRICDEDAPQGSGFSADVCRQWEAAFSDGARLTPGTRRAMLRITFVLGSGGALQTLGGLTRWFLGGTVGSGRQYYSWSHIDDLTRMVLWVIENPQAKGFYNATSPNPVRNRDFMRSLRKALHRPWSPPAPAPLVRLGSWLMGTEPELALKGRRVIPARLLAEGFAFEFPDLDAALRNALARAGE